MELTTGAIVEITGKVVKGKTYGSLQTTLVPFSYSKPVKVLVLGKCHRHTGVLTGGHSSYDEYEPAYLTSIVTHAVYIVMPIDKHSRYRKPIAVLPEQII